jgi:hypothetical protein
MKMLTEVSTMLTMLASRSGGLPSAGLLYILCALAAVGEWRPHEEAPTRRLEMSTERDRATEGVLWPRGRKTVDVRPLAKRLDTLDGITIGELWDDLFRGDEIFPLLREELGRRFPGVRFVDYRVFGSTHGGEEHRTMAELPDKLREHGVDAVISGMAC